MLRARVLIDNQARSALAVEWGFSVYIEYRGYRILLDTGASDLFTRNAAAMGISLEEIDFGVLSHAHYDHADGMAAFFAGNRNAPFYIRKGTKENCYSARKIFMRYIGIHRGFLKTYRNRLIYAEGDQEVVPGVTLLPHKTRGLSCMGKASEQYVREGGRMLPDSYEHEQSLVFDTGNGLVIFNSCCHGGVDHIIREVQETWPNRKLLALIGGFHLFRASEDEVRALAARIRKTGIEKLYTGHCTGEAAFEVLKEELGDQVESLYTGMEIQI